jgi:hypothetical protein
VIKPEDIRDGYPLDEEKFWRNVCLLIFLIPAFVVYLAANSYNIILTDYITLCYTGAPLEDPPSRASFCALHLTRNRYRLHSHNAPKYSVLLCSAIYSLCCGFSISSLLDLDEHWYEERG